MSMRAAATAIAIGWALIASAPWAWAEVDLAWSPQRQSIAVGAVVDIGLLAVSDSDADQSFVAMDVVLTWDPAILELQGNVDNDSYPWLVSDFQPDEGDGLNDSLLDGDAKYTALGNFSSPATATPEGLLVTTFRFHALAPAESAQVVIEPQLGQYSFTRVFGADYPNQNVTGLLSDASVTVVISPELTLGEVAVSPGRTAYVVVGGAIDGQSTAGVTLMVELVPQSGSTGTLRFTPGPPSDILELGDPWVGAGSFTAYDTDLTGSETLNGSIADNGTFIPEPTYYSGLLAAFPLVASADAEGTWDLVLSTSVGDSSWEGLVTVLAPSTVRIVSPGDHDGNGRIDFHDYSGLSRCFTGSLDPSDPPAYPITAGLSCGVFDFDEDGDVDLADYDEFGAMMNGPGP